MHICPDGFTLTVGRAIRAWAESKVEKGEIINRYFLTKINFYGAELPRFALLPRGRRLGSIRRYGVSSCLGAISRVPIQVLRSANLALGGDQCLGDDGRCEALAAAGGPATTSAV